VQAEKEQAHPPFGEKIRQYLRRDLAPDLTAGLSVAVLAVPQAMAFAHLAGLPPMHGVYAAMVGGLVASICSSSELVICGPTNAISIVLFSSVVVIPPEHRVDTIALLTFLVGILQCTFGLARLGALLRYVSHSVVVGFASGAALLIIARQLPALVGVPGVDEGRFVPLVYKTAKELLAGHWHGGAILLGTGTMIFIAACNRLEERIPATFVAVVGSALVVHYFGADNLGIAVVGTADQPVHLLPRPYFPRFTIPQAESLAGDALAIALLGLVQSASIARALAARQESRLRPSQDFLAQGFMNVLCSVLQGFAGSGSFVRSALNVSSGARTRLSGIFASLLIPLIVLGLRPLYTSIPEAALAGVIIVAAFRMIDWEHIRISFLSTPGSTAVLLTTFLATLILRVQFGIYAGVLLSLAIFIRLTSQVNVTRWVPAEEGDFRELDLHRPFPPHEASVINVEGDLFFGAVEDFEDKLSFVAQNAEGVVVLRLRRVRAMGSTAADAIMRFHGELRSKRVTLLVCGLEKELYEIFRRSGLKDVIGEDNLFRAEDLLLDSTRRALRKAREILRSLHAEQNKGDPTPGTAPPPET